MALAARRGGGHRDLLRAAERTPAVAEPPSATAPAQNGRLDGIEPLDWGFNPQLYPPLNSEIRARAFNRNQLRGRPQSGEEGRHTVQPDSSWNSVGQCGAHFVYGSADAGVLAALAANFFRFPPTRA
jgi:hypothetical protein